MKVHADNPGVIHAKEHLESPEVKISIFKRGVNAVKVRSAGIPDEISPGGLTRERQEYLYTQVRPFMRPGYEDITCPLVS